MTLLEVAKHALEAMEDAMYRADTHEFYDAKESLRYAIEQAEQAEQEPVAWVEPKWLDPDTRGWPSDSFASQPIEGWLPLYTAPTPRKPLTDEEIVRLMVGEDRVQLLYAKPDDPYFSEFAQGAIRELVESGRAIERAHGIGEQHE